MNHQGRGGSKGNAVDAAFANNLVDGGVFLNRPATLFERDSLDTTAICTKPSQADLGAAAEQVVWADDWQEYLRRQLENDRRETTWARFPWVDHADSGTYCRKAPAACAQAVGKAATCPP